MGTKNNPGAFDCFAAAAPDEPMFVLLARDEKAPDIVVDWVLRRAGLVFITGGLQRSENDVRSKLESAGKLDAKAEEALKCAEAMRLFYTSRIVTGGLGPQAASKSPVRPFPSADIEGRAQDAIDRKVREAENEWKRAAANLVEAQRAEAEARSRWNALAYEHEKGKAGA